MNAVRCELGEAERLLRRTPAVVRALLLGLPESWTTSNYGPGTWSAKEIVAHLVFGERTDWVPRAKIMLEHGTTRAFDAFDRAGHAPLVERHTLTELLDLFERERGASLASFGSLCASTGALDTVGLHPALGRVTVANLLATWVVHDLNHIAQTSKALAFQWKPHVGPWEAYLSVLAPPNPR